MDSTAIMLVIDAALMVLLVAVIVMAVRLQQRLVALRSGQDELRQTIDGLNGAISDAQRSVATLKLSASELQASLGDDIRKASALSDELKLITEAGNNLADRVERGLSGVGAGQSSGQGFGQHKSSSVTGPGLAEPLGLDDPHQGSGSAGEAQNQSAESDGTAAAVREQQALLAALKEAR